MGQEERQDYVCEYMRNNPITMKKIDKDDIKNKSQNDLLFLSTPGRMGELTDCIFVMKEDGGINFYYCDYCECNSELLSSFPFLDDTKTVRAVPFADKLSGYNPDELFHNDYFNFVNMGFGNCLFVNKNIYDDFMTLYKKEQKGYKIEYKEGTMFFSRKAIVMKLFNE